MTNEIHNVDEAAEVWLPIKDYENFYLISSLGRVKGLKRNKIKRPTLCQWGYPTVSLTKPNLKLKSFKVHRLVAIHFIPNPENKPQVNHKFGIKTDNRVSQLEWATDKEQQEHAFKFGLNKNHKGALHNSAKITDEIFDKCLELRKSGMTYVKIQKTINTIYQKDLSRTAINEALLGRNWSHKKSEYIQSLSK